MEKILITGGSGFIGTNFIDSLAKNANYEIQNLDMVKPKKNFHNKYWVQVDLRRHDDVMSALEAFAPDCVIHLGARTDLNGTSTDNFGSSQRTK